MGNKSDFPPTHRSDMCNADMQYECVGDVLMGCDVVLIKGVLGDLSVVCECIRDSPSPRRFHTCCSVWCRQRIQGQAVNQDQGPKTQFWILNALEL